MSFSQRETPLLAELCECLVENQYGDLAARVFSVLARHGRQTLGALTRASLLTSRQIKHGLVVLVQQHLAFHSGHVDPNLTSYEIDWEHAYTLVRYGRILKSVEDRFGDKAANVMSNILTLGHTKIKDLRDAYFPAPAMDSDDESDDGLANGPDKKATTNGGGSLFVNGTDGTNGTNGTSSTNGVVGTNGTSKINGVKRPHPDDEEEEDQQHARGGGDKTIQSMAELDSIIHILMLQGWVMKAEWTQYLGPGDFHDMAHHEAIEMFNDGRVPNGTKEKDIVARGIVERKRAIRDDWLKVPTPQTRKPTAAEADLTRSNKRLKLGMGNQWSATRDEIVVLDEDLVVRANPEKVTVAMRTEILVRIVRQLLGYVPSKVYEAILKQLEFNMARCYDAWDDPPIPDPAADLNREIDPLLLVSAREVAKNIDPTVDLFEGLDPHAIVYLTSSISQVDKHGRIDPPLDPFEIKHDEKTKLVHEHIRTLADHPFHFVKWHSRAGFSQWQIQFDQIAPCLIQHEIETTIAAGNEREKKYGIKLVRALSKKGKLDERQMGNVMMMPPAEIRSVVNALALRGFIQTQEIPRVERREAKHSLFLIWYDCQRAREKLLNDTYKGMVRILERLAYEKEKVQDLLSKAERTDVAGNEEKWLSTAELDGLKHWKDVQNKLLLQLFRMDDMVAILRDFMGPMVTA